MSTKYKICRTHIDKFPENRRKTRYFKVIENDNFKLELDVKKSKIEIIKKDNIYYSILPYDTARKYIDFAIFLSIKDPYKADSILTSNKKIIYKYIYLALNKTENIENRDDEYILMRIKEEVRYLINNKYYRIQVLGRLLQHLETGWLSANLEFKFLYNYNILTGNLGYIKEKLNFYNEIKKELPISISKNCNMLLLNDKKNTELPIALKNELNLVNNSGFKTITKDILSDDEQLYIKNLRKNYIAQSIPPSILEYEYMDIKSKPFENFNNINVISDIHSKEKELPIINNNFNIIVGDLSDNKSESNSLRGVGVIGNHDLLDCLRYEKIMGSTKAEFLNFTTDVSKNSIRFNEKNIFRKSKDILESKYKGITFLNNELYILNNIKYIGLTVPICYVNNKEQFQKELVLTLKKLLCGDKKIPTIIISHAPLFNELSNLDKESKSYNDNFICVNRDLENIFKDYNIIGVIHGHHHIPSSKGIVQEKTFVGKKIFTICSIYSGINSGFDLYSYLIEKKYL